MKGWGAGRERRWSHYVYDQGGMSPFSDPTSSNLSLLISFVSGICWLGPLWKHAEQQTWCVRYWQIQSKYEWHWLYRRESGKVSVKSTLFSWCHVCEGGGMGGHVGDQEEAMRDHVGSGGMGGHDGDGEGMGGCVGKRTILVNSYSVLTTLGSHPPAHLPPFPFFY